MHSMKVVKELICGEDLKGLNTHDACILCGDFNSVMHIDERIGSQVRKVEMRDMINCMQCCSMQDIKSVGNFIPGITNNRVMQESIPS